MAEQNLLTPELQGAAIEACAQISDLTHAMVKLVGNDDLDGTGNAVMALAMRIEQLSESIVCMLDSEPGTSPQSILKTVYGTGRQPAAIAHQA